jgi:hypothetical protein
MLGIVRFSTLSAAAQQPAWRQLNADPPGDGDHR